MRLNSSGFVYKIAFFDHKHPFHWPVPRELQTNLCVVFWRFLLNLAKIPLFHLLIILFGLFDLLFIWLEWGVIAVVTIIATGIAGYRPAWLENDDPNKFFVPIERWPKTRSGRHFWPIIPIAILACGYWLVKLSIYLFRSVTEWGNMLRDNPTTLKMSIVILLSILALVTIIIGIYKFRRSETWKMTREVIKAKKQGICPTVTFVPPHPAGSRPTS